MRNEDDRSTFEAEQEILAILSQVQIKSDKTQESVSPASFEEDEDDSDAIVFPVATEEAANVSLILDNPFEEEKKSPVTRKKKARENAPLPVEEPLVTHVEEEPEDENPPMTRVANGVRRLFPAKGDPASEVVRKIVFMLSLAAFLVSLGFLTYYMVLEPGKVNKDNNSYVALFNDTEGNEKAQIDTVTKDIQPSFRQLYDINKDINGWLAFNSTDSDKFMQINLPVVWCGNNDTYLNRSFEGKYSRSGTLFFEQSNTFQKGTSNKVTIIYGHNMASGTMFAPLNKLIGNVYRARSAATLKLDTLYDSSQYKVFAVIVSDEGADAAHRFGYLRTTFTDSEDFMHYVDELRARSLFDYPVDVQPNDQLLILSTCTNKSQVKVGNGRLAVIARRVREGEIPTTDTARIIKNEDVIMPYAWYTAQALTPHAFYTQEDYVIPSDNVTVTTNGDTTTTTTGEATADTTTADTTATTTVTTKATTKATTTTAQTTTAVQTTTATTENTTATTQTTATE